MASIILRDIVCRAQSVRFLRQGTTLFGIYGFDGDGHGGVSIAVESGVSRHLCVRRCDGGFAKLAHKNSAR